MQKITGDSCRWKYSINLSLLTSVWLKIREITHCWILSGFVQFVQISLNSINSQLLQIQNLFCFLWKDSQVIFPTFRSSFKNSRLDASQKSIYFVSQKIFLTFLINHYAHDFTLQKLIIFRKQYTNVLKRNV